ncbi:MAG: sigma-70 family RNA polymerase sigma factor [Sphingomonas sp.]
MTNTRSTIWPKLAFSRSSQLRRQPTNEDPAAALFRQQVLPHLDAAYSYARYLARSGTAAEDIVQEAFLRAWKSFATCRGSARPWLLAIVRNCFHDWVRANNQHVAQSDPLDVVSDLTNDSRPEDTLLHAMDIAMLRETIIALPEPFRETLVLRELEELSYREIATLTATPIGTVMSRLARGRDMLATLLLDHPKGATRT